MPKMVIFIFMRVWSVVVLASFHLIIVCTSQNILYFLDVFGCSNYSIGQRACYLITPSSILIWDFRSGPSHIWFHLLSFIRPKFAPCPKHRVSYCLLHNIIISRKSTVPLHLLSFLCGAVFLYIFSSCNSLLLNLPNQQSKFHPLLTYLVHVYSYQHFPVRYVYFIVIFWLCLSACRCRIDTHAYCYR